MMNKELTTEEQVLITDHLPPREQGSAYKTSTTASATAPEGKSTFFATIRKYASVSDALRLFGALGVAMAMGLFLLEGVEVANDLYRFLTMLGLTTALTAAGLIMSSVLKEQRGSRIFISLGLLSIPVNFTVFGALLYSIIPADSISINYPAFAHWQVGNASELPLALIAGVLVLLPVAWLGFTVLARSERVWLSSALILGSAFLMIPVRLELWSAIIAIVSAASLAWIVKSNHNNSLALKTAEGRYAVALLFLSPIIIAVRSLILYEVSGILMLTLCGGAFLCARHLLSQNKEVNFLTAILTLAASGVAIFFSITLADLLNSYLSNRWDMVIASIVLFLLTHEIVKVSKNCKLANVAGISLVVIATCTLILSVIGTAQPFVIMASSITLLVVAVYGFLFQKAPVTGIALFGITAIVMLNAAALWEAAVQTGWWGIGAAGVIAIISGSMLDRAGTYVEVKS